jgi:hypothetical protein
LSFVSPKPGDPDDHHARHAACRLDRGILILIVPRLLVAIYLIFIGLTGLFL